MREVVAYMYVKIGGDWEGSDKPWVTMFETDLGLCIRQWVGNEYDKTMQTIHSSHFIEGDLPIKITIAFHAKSFLF